MDTDTLLLGFVTFTLLGVTLHAWRLGNEARDVSLLGFLAGLSGVGTVVTALL